MTAPRDTLVDEHAEIACLGHYLVRGREAFQAWPGRAIDFTPGPRRATYEAMERLAARGEAIELPTVHAELARDHLTPPISGVVLADYAEAATASPGMLLGRLRDLTARRTLVRLCEGGKLAAHDGEQHVDAILDRLIDKLPEVTTTVARLEAAPDLPTLEQRWLAARACNDANGPDAVRTAFVDLNYLLNDLPRGEVVAVGGRPGVGKTVFAFQTALHAALAGTHVLFASAEMSWEQLVARAKTSQTGIPLKRLLGREALSPTDLAALRGETLPPVRVFDKAGMTTGDIRAVVARYAITPRPFDLVVVDHLHHLRDPEGTHDTRYVQVSRMIGALKDIAKAHRCVAVVACQLNRDAADRAPSIADLRDAGTIEEVASIVVLLHRDKKTPTECEVRVAKNRNGPEGVVKLYFDAQRVQFRDLERTEPSREWSR